jgi:hypothetical protein
MALNPAIPPFIPGSTNASLMAYAEKIAELHELQTVLLPYFEAPYWGVSTTYVSSTIGLLTLTLYRVNGSRLVR